MKPEFFKPDQHVPRGVPTLSITINGMANFNSAACSELPFIQKNAKIAFCRDGEKGDLYLINRVEDGVVLNRYGKKGDSFSIQFQNKTFRQQVEKWLNIQSEKPIRFRIATEATEFNGNVYHALMLMK